MSEEKILGREVEIKKVFQVDGTFQSLYAAEKWLKENGFDFGSLSEPNPVAVMKGDYYDYGLPHKWKNFSEKEIKSVHGIITGDKRNGPVNVYIFKN